MKKFVIVLVQLFCMLIAGCSGMSYDPLDKTKWQAKIYSNPTGAEIYVDGEYLGTAPLKFSYPSIGVSDKEIAAKFPSVSEQSLTTGYYVFEVFFDFINNKATTKEYPSAFSLFAETKEVAFGKRIPLPPEIMKNSLSDIEEMRASLPSDEVVTPPPELKPPKRPIPHKEIIYVPTKELILPITQLPKHFNLNVRQATQADTEKLKELRSFTQTFVGMELGISALGVWEAYAIPSFFSGSLVASAIFIAPTAIILNEIDRRHHKIIMRTLQEYSLLDLIQANLERRLPKPDPMVNEVPEIELIIVSYGFTNQPLCLFVNAAISVNVRGNPVYEDMIYLEPFLRSLDSPPPICGDLGDFAKNDGQLILNGFKEYGQVLTAIVVKRTKVLPWKE